MLHNYLYWVESSKQQIEEGKLGNTGIGQLLSESGFVLCIAPPSLSRDRRDNNVEIIIKLTGLPVFYLSEAMTAICLCEGFNLWNAAIAFDIHLAADSVVQNSFSSLPRISTHFLQQRDLHFATKTAQKISNNNHLAVPVTSYFWCSSSIVVFRCLYRCCASS